MDGLQKKEKHVLLIFHSHEENTDCSSSCQSPLRFLVWSPLHRNSRKHHHHQSELLEDSHLLSNYSCRSPWHHHLVHLERLGQKSPIQILLDSAHHCNHYDHHDFSHSHQKHLVSQRRCNQTQSLGNQSSGNLKKNIPGS